MRLLFLFLIGLLIGCSSCKKPGTETIPTPTTTTSPPDAGTTTTTDDAGETTTTVVEVIDWKTPEEIQALAKTNLDLCIFAYFPDVLNGDKQMEQAFVNQDVVRIVNKLFVAMEFPLTPEVAPFVMEEFEIKKLPALIVAPPEDKFVLQIEGTITGVVLYDTIVLQTMPGQIFEKCHLAKEKLN